MEENRNDLEIKFACCSTTYVVSQDWHKKMNSKAHCFGCNDEDKINYKISNK